MSNACGQLLSFNEVVISKRSNYARHVNEVVIVQYLLLPATCRVSCGDCYGMWFNKEGINFKVTYQERPLVAATLLSLCSCTAPTGSSPPTSRELAAAARKTPARKRLFFADWKCQRGQLNPNWRKWPHAQIRSGTCRYPERNITQCALNFQRVAIGDNMTDLLDLNLLFFYKIILNKFIFKFICRWGCYKLVI